MKAAEKPREIAIDCALSPEDTITLREWVRTWPPAPFPVCIVVHVRWKDGGRTRLHLTQEEQVLNAAHR